MCGTVVIAHFSWQQVNAKLLEAITHPREHRGLDEENYFSITRRSYRKHISDIAKVS